MQKLLPTVKWGDKAGWSSEDGLAVSVMHIAEEKVLVAGCNGYAHCLDHKSGRVLWSRDLGVGDFPGFVTLQYLTSAANRDSGGVLLAGCNGLAFGIELERGNFVWKCDVPGTRYQCLSLLVHHDVVYCGSYGKVWP